jgi:hypothetical protein
VDILEELGTGRDTGRDNAEGVAEDVASVNLGGKAEKAREEVLSITGGMRGMRAWNTVLFPSHSHSAHWGLMMRVCPFAAIRLLHQGQGCCHGVKVCPGPVPLLPALLELHYSFHF